MRIWQELGLKGEAHRTKGLDDSPLGEDLQSASDAGRKMGSGHVGNVTRPGSAGDAAAELGITTGAVAIHRLRERFRVAVCSEMNKVDAEEDVSEELRYLIEALS